jgi:hypothetical protein
MLAAMKKMADLNNINHSFETNWSSLSSVNNLFVLFYTSAVTKTT